MYYSKEEVDRICRQQFHNEQAKRAGISPEELWKKKYTLKIAWENGGGIEGARDRLKFAENYLKKNKGN